MSLIKWQMLGEVGSVGTHIHIGMEGETAKLGICVAPGSGTHSVPLCCFFVRSPGLPRSPKALNSFCILSWLPGYLQWHLPVGSPAKNPLPLDLYAGACGTGGTCQGLSKCLPHPLELPNSICPEATCLAFAKGWIFWVQHWKTSG